MKRILTACLILAAVPATKELTSDKAQVLKEHNLPDSSTFSADFTTATGAVVPAQ